MNLFRSEEHARNWSGFSAETEAGLLPLADMMAICSTPRMRERLNGHYVSSIAAYLSEFAENLMKVTGNEPFWAPPGFQAKA